MTIIFGDLILHELCCRLVVPMRQNHIIVANHNIFLVLSLCSEHIHHIIQRFGIDTVEAFLLSEVKALKYTYLVENGLVEDDYGGALSGSAED